MPNLITVLTKPRGKTQTLALYEQEPTEIVYLDVPIIPTSPITLGSSVQIYALELNPRRSFSAHESCDDAKYMARPMNIHGTIMGVRTMDPEVTELVLRNNDEQGKIKYAYISLPHVEGVTIRLPMWMRLLRWIVVKLVPRTRRIPLEPLAALRWKTRSPPVPGNE